MSFKLIYVYEGSIQVDIDGKCYEVPQDYSVLVFPYCTFSIDCEDAHYAWMEFSGYASVAMMGRIAFSKRTPVMGPIGIDSFEDFFILPERTGTSYSRFRRGGCLLLLLSYYIEKFPGKNEGSEGYVIRSCQFIEKNFCKRGFGAKDVVENIKVDRSYLYRLFKDEVGMSVSDYITRRRIGKAEMMLANSNLTVKDVAYSVGYSDQMYFSRVFKKFNGNSPTQFRERLFKRDPHSAGNQPTP